MPTLVPQIPSEKDHNSGNFASYAGPVTAAAAGECVKWGGKAGVSA
ncbi:MULTISPECIES: hypothetical protein [unclassified Nonomuraea]